jgi:DNA-binding protein YbaB
VSEPFSGIVDGIADKYAGRDLDAEIRDARRRLAEARRPGAASDVPRRSPGERPDGDGVGEAADGRVVATASGGRLTAVTIEPRLMRLDAEELSGHLRTAVDAALSGAADRDAGEGAERAVDVRALSEQLARVREDTARIAGSISQALVGAMAQADPRAGMTGDASMSDVDAVLGEARRDLVDLPEALGGGAGEPGTGSGADGLVTATVGPGGRVESVELRPYAMRMASQTLGEQTVVAVNEALERARSAASDAAGAGGLAARAQELQDQSIAQMRRSTQALRAIMMSIREP